MVVLLSQPPCDNIYSLGCQDGHGGLCELYKKLPHSCYFTDLAPVPLSIFRSNSKFNENSELSWRVQNFVVIGKVYFKPGHFKFWSNFEFDRNIVSGTGARSLDVRNCMHFLPYWAHEIILYVIGFGPKWMQLHTIPCHLISNFKSFIFKCISVISFISISHETFPQVNATVSQWWLFNIGWYNGLVLSGNMALPKKSSMTPNGFNRDIHVNWI